MAYSATVYRILIASPSDVVAERKAIPEVIYAWNATHAESKSVVLLPVLWETHSTPEMGKRPQEILNDQLVESCDILIGTFWTRIGTPTGIAESGTIEEIEEFIKANKPVLLYFSSAPVVPNSIDTDQYDRLKKFKAKCQTEGLTDNYETIAELREKLERHLNSIVQKIHGDELVESIDTYQDFETLDSLSEQLQSIITRNEVDWSTEKNSEPMDIEEGKYILESFSSDLIDLRANLEDKINQIVMKDIDTQITNLKKLRNHRLMVDGGRSYREFWKTGDNIFQSLRTITTDMKYIHFYDDFAAFDGWIPYRDGNVIRSDERSHTGAFSLKKISYNDPSGGFKDIKRIGRGFIFSGWIYRPSGVEGGPADRLAIEDTNGNGYGFSIRHEEEFFLLAIEIRIEGAFKENLRTENVTSSLKSMRDVWYHFDFQVTKDEIIILNIDCENQRISHIDAENSDFTMFHKVAVHGGYPYYIDDIRIRRT